MPEAKGLQFVSGLLPGSKDFDELSLNVLRDGFFGQLAQSLDGESHLLKINPAPVAKRQMLLEASLVLRRQGALEVFRDEFDELLAGHSGGVCSHNSLGSL
jgi:hypothetical protein